MPTEWQLTAGADFFNQSLIILGAGLLVVIFSFIGWRGHRPVAVPIGLASTLGLIALVGGILIGFSIQGTFMGTNIYALSLGSLCAGTAWVLGAGIGVNEIRNERAPTLSEARALRVGSILFLVAAILVVQWTIVPSNFDLRTTDMELSPYDYARWASAMSLELAPLRRLIWLDGVIAALTCVMLSVRNRLRRSAILVGMVSMVLVVGLVFVEFSLVPNPAS